MSECLFAPPLFPLSMQEATEPAPRLCGMCCQTLDSAAGAHCQCGAPVHTQCLDRARTAAIDILVACPACHGVSDRTPTVHTPLLKKAPLLHACTINRCGHVPWLRCYDCGELMCCVYHCSDGRDNLASLSCPDCDTESALVVSRKTTSQYPLWAGDDSSDEEEARTSSDMAPGPRPRRFWFYSYP